MAELTLNEIVLKNTDNTVQDSSPEESLIPPYKPQIHPEIFASYNYNGLSLGSQAAIKETVDEFLNTGRIPDFTKAAPMLFNTQPGAAMEFEYRLATLESLHGNYDAAESGVVYISNSKQFYVKEMYAPESFEGNVYIPNGFENQLDEPEFKISILNATAATGRIISVDLTKQEKFEISRQEVLRINAELLSDSIDDYLRIEESEELRQAMLDEQYFAFYHYLIRFWAVTERADATKSPDTEQFINYLNMLSSAKAIAILQKKEADFYKIKESLKPSIRNSFAPFLDQGEEQLDSDYFLGLLRRANAIRLCWLWDRILMEMYIQCAHDLLLPITIFADQVSWSLYLFLASIHLTGVFGGYFEAKAREKELQIEAKKAAWAHFKLRRGVLINDLVWGFANLACCFWLNGFGMMAYYGDLITGILLCMDLASTIWDYRDDLRTHEDDMRRYNEQILALITRFKQTSLVNHDLRSALDALEEHNKHSQIAKEAEDLATLRASMRSLANKSENKQAIEVLFWQLNSLYSARDNCANDWAHRQKLFMSDIIYAVSLVLTFSLLCCFYLTVLPISFPAMMVSMGAISLGATTLLWRSANSAIECSSIQTTQKMLTNEFDELIKDFLSKDAELYKQKQLYLKILQQGAKIGYQEDLLLYTRLETFRTTANSILIPVGLAMTFLFAPAMTVGVPTYIFVLLGVLVATVAVSMFIKRYYKPQDSKWIAADGTESSKPVLSIDMENGDNEFDSFKQLLESTSKNADDNSNILRLIKSARTEGDQKLFENAFNDYQYGSS